MTQLKKRIEELERTKPGTSAACLAFVHPGEDAEQKQHEALAAFKAEHGREPDIRVLVRFVEPGPVSEDGCSEDEDDGVTGEGTTRANERLALLERTAGIT